MCLHTVSLLKVIWMLSVVIPIGPGEQTHTYLLKDTLMSGNICEATETHGSLLVSESTLVNYGQTNLKQAALFFLAQATLRNLQ